MKQRNKKKMFNYPYKPGPSDIYRKNGGASTVISPVSGILFCRLGRLVLLFYCEKNSEIFMSPGKFKRAPDLGG